MTTRFFFFTFMVCFFSVHNDLVAQTNPIQLINPSFEDYPRAATVPVGWRDCGFSGESPADTHPSGQFEVTKPPSDGNTYLGMVVRDNDTWERVAQKLSEPLQRGNCYSFSLNLCRSELYVSLSRETGIRANYVQPIKLIIWGGDEYCSKKEQLGESPLIANTSWQPYMFKFEPKQTHSYITLEAFYKTPVLFPYNGNILVDNASDIMPIPCEDTPVLAKIPEIEFLSPNDQPIVINNQKITVKAHVKNISEKLNIIFKVNGTASNNFSFNPETGIVSGKIQRLKRGNNRIIFQTTNAAGKSQDSAILIYEPEEIVAYQEPPAQPQIYEAPIKPKVIPTAPPKKNTKIEGFSRAEISTGQIIKISSLAFKMNQAALNTSAYSRLDEIYEFLKENKEVIVEIGGHTSGLCDEDYCNQLSTNRAKEVASYLMDKGIPKNQLNYKGYGKTKPIASNNTTIGRRKNQRVEIKILSTDG